MPPRTPSVDEEPEGLRYLVDFLTAEEEAQVLRVLDEIAFAPVVMRGQAAKRTVAHYGYDYRYESWDLVPTDPLPAPLTWLCDRCAALADVASDAFAQVLISRYPPGAGIGWHRDAPMFGPQVVGVSLGSACRMRFQRRAGGVRRTWALELAPRSAYVLGGAARSAWQHSIPATPALRYSITFRSLRRASAPASA
jgi:alkylated DNA repair protein (DNA oxidative demethylase)